MTVNQSGTVTAAALTPTSDRNAKENFEPVNAQDALAQRPQRFYRLRVE
jgi:hypothetical protein